MTTQPKYSITGILATHEYSIHPGTIRDVLHNLNINDSCHSSIYEKMRKMSFIEVEGLRYEAYDDETGKKIREQGGKCFGKATIGIGFNMSRPEARAEWDEAFGGELDFDAAKRGEYKLTEAQVDQLYQHSLKTRLKELHKNYPNILNKLRLNERLAVEDAYFNHPNLAKAGTKFHANMNKYYETGDRKYLSMAIEQITKYSNREKKKGIDRRRVFEGELLNSQKAPLYSNPYDAIIPQREIEAELNKTILPRDLVYWPRSVDQRYFIWRTQCDSKVRKDHMLLEGKVFERSNPPVIGIPKEPPNCRCWAEDLPQGVIIKSTKSLIAHKNWYELNLHVLGEQITHLERLINDLI